MKNTNSIRTKVLSVLLVLVMVLGVVPAGMIATDAVPMAAAAGATQAESVKIDFIDFAKRASQQSWWSNLRASDTDGIRVVGSGYNTTVTTKEYNAYKSLNSFAAQDGWKILEGDVAFNNKLNGRKIFFNSDTENNGDYGIRFYPMVDSYAANGDDRSRLMFSVEVATAGLYHFNMSVLNEAVTSTVANVDGSSGRGIGNIYVNDELVYEEYPFQDYSDTIRDVSFGAVNLKKGANTIIIDIVKDHFGTGSSSSSGRRCCNLRSIEFIPLGTVQVGMGRTMELDLRQTYLPFDAVVTGTTYTVESADPSVAKAKFEADGDLLITGFEMDESTTVTVYDGSSVLCSFTVEVVEPTAPDNGTFYTIDGFKAVTLSYGNVGEGDATYYVDSVQSTEDEIRENGAVYFKSNDKNVVTVDPVTGDVTAVGEGTTRVVAYVLMDGVITSDDAIVTVTDETDLASIDVTTAVDYVGVGSRLQLHTTGLKSSGSYADMDLYPVAWEVDDTNVASVSEDGWLTGLQEGTVTVTGTAGVDGVAVTDSVTITVVEDQTLVENDMIFDFTYTRVSEMETATIETHGIEINRQRTYQSGNTIEFDNTSGLELYVGQANAGLCFDFVVERSGWYQLEILGKSIYYAGVTSDVFVDDSYMGIIDFASTEGETYSEGGKRNTVYLEAGIHEIDVLAKSYGYQFLGKIMFHPVANPGDVEIEVSAGEELVVGQTTDVELTLTDGNNNKFYLLQQTAKPAYTNYYILSSSNENAVTVSGSTLTAVGTGSSTITVSGEVLGEAFSKQITVRVKSGSIVWAEITADATTVKPTADPFQLSVVAYGADGTALNALPSGTTVSYECDGFEIIMVEEDGTVNVVGNEGSALVTATVTEGSNVLIAQQYITVTAGKSEPTIFTYEERANAQANTSKFLWAYQMKNTATKQADVYVANLDTIYNMWLFDDLPRTTRVGYKNETGYRYCRYCNSDLVATWGNYPWIVDPLENPWKITCPACKNDFPSNDFAAYLESGMGEDGRFHRENADSSLLTNDLYPEMGEGWGVDDGLGYVTGETDEYGHEVVHTYIGYYMACVMYGLGDYDKHSLTDIVKTLTDAYIYSGKIKYGRAGAILVDRIADIYPTYDIADWNTSQLAFSDGGGGRGKFIGCIWDAILSQYLAKAVDAFWPCATDAQVIEYLQQDHILKIKGLTAEDITPEYIRTNAENGILLEAFECATTDYYNGNFGMEEAGIAYCAVALDRQPETNEMFEWVFHEERNGGLGKNAWNTGGDVSRVLTEDVSRDGFGYEVSYLYNSLWTQYLLDLADALHNYPDAAQWDLWNNPKFINMYTAFLRLTVCGHLTPQVGEAGFVQSTHNQIGQDKMLTAFLATGDVTLAQGVYAANGNSVDGLHGSIFLADPTACQTDIKNIIAEHGEWNFSQSDMMSGFGIAILREGPARYTGKTGNAGEFFDYWMYFGYSNTAHAYLQALAIDLEAFGIGMSSGMGYPTEVVSTGWERMQWTRNTSSKNTVVVDDLGQSVMEENGNPMHFEDAERVKIMDAEAPEAYPQTDIYRRTVVTVAAENGVHYAVDFFRVLGGSEHVYSFHGATTLEPTTEGLNMVRQPMGTYEGPEVPFGAYVSTDNPSDASTNAGSGYSWLDDVYRDDSPETYFSVDWEIEDFHGTLADPNGIHLKLHMVSEEPMTDGHPPQTGRNPSHVEYTMIRRSGNDGMDTLFTAVIEPYRDNELIASVELVDIDLLEGTEGIYDRAAAMKVTLVGGREDYIAYATNADCLYSVKDENGTEMFRFSGFTCVCSYENDVLTYAHGSEISEITDTNSLGNVIEGAASSVTGTVTDFTKEYAFDYFLTVTMDQPVLAEELIGRYIFVNNDGVENAAYRIHDAEVNGNIAVLNLNNQDLIRSFVDAANEELGYVYNIAENDTYIIPLSQTYVAGNCNHQTVARAEDNGVADGKHYETVVCEECPRITTNLKPCADKNVDNICDLCGDIMSEGKTLIIGSNMTLGNELKLNFIIDKSAVDTSKTYTATLVLDGITEETRTVTLTSDCWTDYNSSYYAVSMGVAAKGMPNTISVVITDENGDTVDSRTDSIRGYAMRALNSGSMGVDVHRLIVDMLNYGAEAQNHFKYNTADLANNQLTAEQKNYATESVTYTNKAVKGTNAYGSNVQLVDNICFSFYFKNRPANMNGMYGELTFTNYHGKEIKIELTQADLIPSTSTNRTDLIRVYAEETVVADCRQMITCTVYNADGTVFGTSTDSVESYVARAQSTGEALYPAILKFADSAYTYLINR